MFGMRDVRDVGCWECEIFVIRDVQDVRCWGCGMLGCGMFGMWDVRDVGYGTSDVCWDVGC